MDKIILNTTFQCYIGVPKEERNKKQEVRITIELYTSIKKAAKSGNINDTIDYSKVHSVIKKYIDSKKHVLIETVAEELAKIVLSQFSVKKVLVRVEKPKVNAAIIVTRGRTS